MSSFKDKVGNLLDVAIFTFGEKLKDGSTAIEYRPKDGLPYKIPGVFDRNFEIVDPDTEVVIASNIPRLGIKLKDLVCSPIKGDEVLIQAELFRVDDSQEDGQGGATLVLHRIADESDYDRFKPTQ